MLRLKSAARDCLGRGGCTFRSLLFSLLTCTIFHNRLSAYVNSGQGLVIVFISCLPAPPHVSILDPYDDEMGNSQT